MVDHYRHASEMPFQWRFAGGPMMAHNAFQRLCYICFNKAMFTFNWFWYTIKSPAYNLRPPSFRQQNTIRMTFRWWTESGSLLYVYWGTGSFYTALGNPVLIFLITRIILNLTPKAMKRF